MKIYVHVNVIFGPKTFEHECIYMCTAPYKKFGTPINFMVRKYVNALCVFLFIRK